MNGKVKYFLNESSENRTSDNTKTMLIRINQNLFDFRVEHKKNIRRCNINSFMEITSKGKRE